jgi:hypothetical protein
MAQALNTLPPVLVCMCIHRVGQNRISIIIGIIRYGIYAVYRGGGAYLRTVFSVLEIDEGIIRRKYAVFPYKNTVQNCISNCTPQTQVRIPAGTVTLALPFKY